MLRDEIAALIEPHIAEDDWGAGLHLKLADQIVALIDAGDLESRVERLERNVLPGEFNR